MQPSAVRSGRRSALLIGIGLVAIVGIVAMMSNASPSAVIGHLRAIPRGAIAIAAAGWCLLVVMQAFRWRSLVARESRATFADFVAMRLIGNLANAMLPARGGDVVRVELLSRLGQTPRAAAAGVELKDVLVDKVGWLPALLVVCAFGSPPAWMLHTAPLLLLLPLVAVGVVALGRRLGRRWSWLSALSDALSSDWRRALVIALLVAPLPWMLETWVLLASSRAAGIALDPAQAFVLLTALNLALLVPTPANLGTTEAGASAALVAFGVPLDAAVAFAVAYHIAQLVPAIALGLAASFALARRAPPQPTVAPAGQFGLD